MTASCLRTVKASLSATTSAAKNPLSQQRFDGPSLKILAPEVTGGANMELQFASPECTHFSAR
jgi:hypothetical protein